MSPHAPFLNHHMLVTAHVDSCRSSTDSTRIDDLGTCMTESRSRRREPVRFHG